MRTVSRLSLAAFSLALVLPIIPSDTKAGAISSKVIITGIKLGGLPDPKEFVTLYNQSDADISLEGWKLEYAKTSFDALLCSSDSWADHSGSSTTLSGLIPAGTAVSVTRSLNDSASGSLRVISPDFIVHDLVGWGPEAGCFDVSPAVPVPNGKSLQRYIDCETQSPVDTDNNAIDFVLTGDPGPGILSGPLTAGCETTEPPPDEEGPPQGGQGGGETENGCGGIMISELLPNPLGSDTGKEFIELYNPASEPVSLEGCKLSTSANTKVFTFGPLLMQPGQYSAFYETGLTLENLAGGSVLLIDKDEVEIGQVDYPSGLEEDVAWALIDGWWVQTFSPTPDGPNSLLSEKPCASGEVRNPDSGRCVNSISEAAGLISCRPGQERNPETKRCRNIASLSSMLKACEPGQTRNSETNRCRKNDASSLAGCKEGQERNPETNRCRNVSNLSSDDLTYVKDVLAAASADKTSWFVAAGSMVLALGYAIWEWRSEISQQLLSLKSRLSV